MANKVQAKGRSSAAQNKKPRTSAPLAPRRPKPTIAAASRKTSSVAVTKQLLPAASLKAAKKKFANFSASRFTETTRPVQFLAPKDVGSVKAAQDLQRTLISKNLAALRDGQARVIAAGLPATTGLGMTLALPIDSLKKLCPSYNAKAGTVDLTELLAFVRKRMSGTQFYASGAAPLVKSAQQSSLQTQAKGLLAAIKGKAPQ